MREDRTKRRTSHHRHPSTPVSHPIVAAAQHHHQTKTVTATPLFGRSFALEIHLGFCRKKEATATRGPRTCLTMSFHHRLPALITAFMSSMAVLLAAFSGASCDFLVLPSTTMPPEGDSASMPPEEASPSIGILCEHGYYDRNGDDMWELSRVFLIASLALGSLSAALAWAVTSYLPPTEMNWRGLSVLAAATAVLQVPVFFLFESKPCRDDYQDQGGGQTCALGSGSYLLIASVVLDVAVTLCTQCTDPPMWALELALWRAPKHGESKRRVVVVPRNSSDEEADDEEEDDDSNDDDDDGYDARFARDNSDDGNEDMEQQIIRVMPLTKSFHQRKEQEIVNQIKRLFSSRWFRRSSTDGDVKAVATESINDDEDDYNYEETLNDSRLILRVLPDGNLPRYDGKKDVESFDGIDDSTANLVEEGKLKPPLWDVGRENETSDDDRDDDDHSMNLVMPENLHPSAGTRVYASEVERHHHVLDSPRSLPPENPLSSYDILADLQFEIPPLPSPPSSSDDDVPSSKPRSESQSSSNDDGDDNDRAGLLFSAKNAGEAGGQSSAPNKLVRGVRNLTRTLKRERRQMRQKKIRRGGYMEMMDDNALLDSSAGADGIHCKLASPPFEVKFPSPAEGAADAMTGAGRMLHDASDGDDDDDDLLDIEDWKALKGGSAAGEVQLSDGFSSDEEPCESNLTYSYYSDPEPECSGDYIIRQRDLVVEDAASALSDDHSSEYSESRDGHSHDSHSRGRPPGRKDGSRRRKRAVSPVESIKSNCSLLHTTINEETEEDIVEELGIRYPISRTYSAPMHSSASFDRKTSGHPRKRMDSFDLVQTFKTKRSGSDAAASSRLPDEDCKQIPRAAVELEKVPRRFPSDEIGSSQISISERPPSDEIASVSMLFEEENPTPGRSFLDDGNVDTSKTEGHRTETDKLSNAAREEETSIHPASTNGSPLASDVAPLDELHHGSKGLGSEQQEKEEAETYEAESEIQQWKEPVIPARKIWKTLDQAMGVSGSFANQSPKELELTVKDEQQDPADINTTDETSDTDDTGCMSRASDSESDDSMDGYIDKKPRGVTGRSRSFVGEKSHIGRLSYSKSLSPTRSNKLCPLLWQGGPTLPNGSLAEDTPNPKSLPANSSSRAREIRIRRLQKGKGYMPLEDTPKRTNALSCDSPKLSYRNPSHDCDTGSDTSTPRRKTWELSDEKKEEDPSYDRASEHASLNNLLQPHLSPLDSAANFASQEKLEAGVDDAGEVRSMLIESSPDYDVVLADLDLQLIDLRRPVGAEYGDDERSL